MKLTPSLIEDLLHEEEGPSLDFKRDQYAFDGADNETKGELLKDILAFANAFRRADAYILIGVEEIRGGKSRVVGVKTHLEDAKLQQFVNSKTQRPVTFSYREVIHGNCSIGIIHVPPQTRPFYPKANYGKALKDTVYVRRGSSTAIAKPEEIARMGAADVASVETPAMELTLVDRNTGKRLGDRVSVDTCTWYDIPPKDNIPEHTIGTPISMGLMVSDPLVNSNFFRDVAAYIETGACVPVSLEMRNTGRVVIHDARLALELHDPKRQCMLIASQDRAARPSSRIFISLPIYRPIAGHSDVNVAWEGETWKVQCHFGKLQPRATVRLQDDLLIGSRAVCEVVICGKVYGDNIDDPIPVRFQLSFNVGSQPVTIEEIKSMAASIAREE